MSDNDVEYVVESDDEFIDRITGSMLAQRKSMGLSQLQLGRRIGHTQVWVSVRERGKQRMTVGEAALMGAALRMPERGKVRKVTRPETTERIREKGVTPATMPTFKAPVPPQRYEKHEKKVEAPAPAPQPAKPPSPVVSAVEIKLHEKEPPKPIGPWLWDERLNVNVPADEVTLPIIALEGTEATELKLTMKDAWKLQAQLLLNLPERITAVADKVTAVESSIEQAIRRIVTNNRRKQVMAAVHPVIQKLVKEEQERVQDARSAAEDAQLQALQAEEDANRNVELLRRKLERLGKGPDREEENAAIMRLQGEYGRKEVQLRGELERTKKEKEEALEKLRRARAEIDRLDEEKEKTKIPDDVVAIDKDEYAHWEERLEAALEVVDELHELIVGMKTSGLSEIRLKGYELADLLKQNGFETND